MNLPNLKCFAKNYLFLHKRGNHKDVINERLRILFDSEIKKLQILKSYSGKYDVSVFHMMVNLGG